MCGEIVNA